MHAILILALLCTSTLGLVPDGTLHGHLSYSQLITWVDSHVLINYPVWTTKKEFGKSVQGRPLLVLCVGEPCFYQEDSLEPTGRRLRGMRDGETHRVSNEKTRFNDLQQGKESFGDRERRGMRGGDERAFMNVKARLNDLHHAQESLEDREMRGMHDGEVAGFASNKAHFNDPHHRTESLERTRRLVTREMQDEEEPGFVIGEAHFNALHHAREPLGMMALVYFVDHLLSTAKEGNATARHLLRTRRLDFVFVVNPDGYIANEVGEGMRRKNFGVKNSDKKCDDPKEKQSLGDAEIGVDLNRNYAICFNQDNKGSSQNPCAIDYEGPSAFSEPETQAMKRLVESRNYRVAFNYHSFGKEVYIPFSCKPKGLTPEESFFRLYASRLTAGNKYHYGQPWNENLYTVNGDAADWMYAAKKIYAVSPEVAPADPVPSEKAGFWVADNQVRSGALEVMDMNYVGAWTSGCYLELSHFKFAVEMQTENPAQLLQKTEFSVYNWGLLESIGELQGSFAYVGDDAELDEDGKPKSKTYVTLQISGDIKSRGEVFAVGMIPNRRGQVAVRDKYYCVVYEVLPDEKEFVFLHRIDPNDDPCLDVFAPHPAAEEAFKAQEDFLKQQEEQATNTGNPRPSKRPTVIRNPYNNGGQSVTNQRESAFDVAPFIAMIFFFMAAVACRTAYRRRRHFNEHGSHTFTAVTTSNAGA